MTPDPEGGDENRERMSFLTSFFCSLVIPEVEDVAAGARKSRLNISSWDDATGEDGAAGATACCVWDGGSLELICAETRVRDWRFVDWGRAATGGLGACD